jgi:tetratricopeptide (TPR) repeat protein
VINEQPDSLDVLATAETYFRQALGVQPANQDILLQWQLAKTYLEAQHNFDRGSWDEAVEALEFIYQEAPEYALGTARQTLYEAYLARGQRSMIVAKYDLALGDFQQAAVIAEEGAAPALRILNAQAKIATTLGALGSFEDAVVVFQNIFEGLNLGEEQLQEYPALSSALEQGAKYANSQNHKAAFKRYSEAIPQALVVYANEVNYTVQPGDYLPQIARTYNIIHRCDCPANQLTDSYQVNPGSKLIIPKGKPYSQPSLQKSNYQTLEDH